MSTERLRLRMPGALRKCFTSITIKNISILMAIVIAFACMTSAGSSQQTQYNITVNGKLMTVNTSAETIDDILADAGIKVNSGDSVKIKGNDITVKLYSDVTVEVYGKKRARTVKRDTVKNVLKSLGVKPKRNDKLTPSPKTVVDDGSVIKVIAVSYKTVTNSRTISYQRCKKLYGKAAKGIKKGESVLVTSTFKHTHHNGVRVARKLISRRFKSVGYKAYDESKYISTLTAPKGLRLDKNGIPVGYSKKLTGTASAYSCGTHTATGKRVRQGYIAVNPKQIPYGTEMFIRSGDGKYLYGYAVAEDTGGFVSWGNTIADLFMASESECVRFGRRNVEIYIL